MARQEKDLLKALANTIANMIQTPDVVSNENENEDDIIEQYRDKDGFINLKGVQDVNEIKRVFDIVDKKNYLETLNKEKNLQDLAEALAQEFMPIMGAKTVNVKVETPEGVGIAQADNDEYKVSSKFEKVEEKLSTEDKAQPTKDIKVAACNDVDEICPTKQSQIKTESGLTVLFDVGGMYNPQFFNAVLYICNNHHFPENVYSEFDIDIDDKVTTHILLPNAWGKIFAGAAEEFGERINAGDKVYIIDPETFELRKINNSMTLWNYAMSLTQEDII